MSRKKIKIDSEPVNATTIYDKPFILKSEYTEHYLCEENDQISTTKDISKAYVFTMRVYVKEKNNSTCVDKDCEIVKNQNYEKFIYMLNKVSSEKYKDVLMILMKTRCPGVFIICDVKVEEDGKIFNHQETLKIDNERPIFAATNEHWFYRCIF